MTTRLERWPASRHTRELVSPTNWAHSPPRKCLLTLHNTIRKTNEDEGDSYERFFSAIPREKKTLGLHISA